MPATSREEAAEASQSYTKCCLCPVTFGRLISLFEILFLFFEAEIIAMPMFVMEERRERAWQGL